MKDTVVRQLKVLTPKEVHNCSKHGARSGHHNPLHIELAVLALVDTGLGAPVAGDLEPLVGAHGQHKAQEPGDTSHPPKAKEHLQWVVRLNFLRDANSTHTKELCNAQI